MKETLERSIEQRVRSAIWDGAMTRWVKIGTGALATIGECLDRCFPDRPVMVVCDPNTYAAAGRRVCEHLRTAGRRLLDPFVFEEEKLLAKYPFVQRLQTRLGETDAIAVAVGSGTINDLTKLASHLCDRPYMVVATAASMDGYTAFGASISRDGFKQTFTCPAPLAVLVDLDVIAQAPPEMNAAGYADLLAKIPAGADWLLADAAGAEPVDGDAWALVQPNLRAWVGNPAGVRQGDRTALAHLVEGLIMGGLAMQRAGSSRPASGADHQFSHLWDMQQHTHEGATPLHGNKVAIGTLASAAMYERVLAMPADDLIADEDALVARWPAWEHIEQAIRHDFPDAALAEQVLRQSRAKYLAPDALARRLRRLKNNWTATCARLGDQLLSPERLQEMLVAAGAPHVPEEIGISRQRLHASHRIAQRIRSRYTVLDIITEADWWTPCVDDLFRNGGFWNKA